MNTKNPTKVPVVFFLKPSRTSVEAIIHCSVVLVCVGVVKRDLSHFLYPFLAGFKRDLKINPFFQYPFTGVLLAQYQTKEIQKIIRWVAKNFRFFSFQNTT